MFQLSGIIGIEATARLREVDPDSRGIIFSAFARDDEIQAALDAGALGYLQKSARREDLITALHTIPKGSIYLTGGLEDRHSAMKLGPSITIREREILALVSQGQANKGLAAELGIVEDTMKRHISNTFQKLEVSDRAQATAEAIRRGMVKVTERFEGRNPAPPRKWYY